MILRNDEFMPVFASSNVEYNEYYCSSIII